MRYAKYTKWFFLKAGIIVLACSCPGFLASQEEVLVFHRLTTAENLSSQNYNSHIFKDSEGFTWISSIDGLNRFDGKAVRQYLSKAGDSLSLVDGNIQKGFFEDAQGVLWFSTVEVIHGYDPKDDVFKRYLLMPEQGNSQPDFHLIHFDPSTNRFWVMVNDSLLLFPKARPGKPKLLDTINHYYSYNFAIQDSEHSPIYQLAVPQRNGWEVRTYRNGNKISQVSYPEQRFPGFLPTSFLFEKDDRLWAGCDTGLVALNMTDGKTQLYQRFNGLSITGITGLAALDERTLVVSTLEKGIFYFDRRSLAFTHRLFSTGDDGIAPFRQPVEHIYLDKDKTLWISSPGKGVFYTNLHKRKFKSFLQNLPGMPNLNFVRAMSEDHFGRIWCLTGNGVAVLNENGTLAPGFEKFRGAGVPFAGSAPYHIFCDRTGRVWVCTLKGLYVLSKLSGTFERVPVPPDSPSPEVAFTFVHQLANGTIWVSSFNAGVFEAVEKNGNISLVPLAQFSSDKRYTQLYDDTSGRLFVSQAWDSLLICQWKEDKLVQEKSLSLPGRLVHAFVEDEKRKTLWVATSNGLFRLDRQEGGWMLRQDPGFPFSTINGLLLNDNGDLWASTNLGLFRYQPDSAKYRAYQLADGLQALEFNFLACLKTSKGAFAFGGVNGVNLFFPDQIQDLQVQARPVITNIVLNDIQPYSGDCALTKARNVSHFKKLILPYGNTLTFHFAALEYSDPAANRFQYQLENLDNDWTPSGMENFARYPILWEGRYIFKVRASNSDGIWSSHVARLEVVIEPPWFRTWQFYLALALAAAGAVYGFYRYRIRQIREKAEINTRSAENKMAALRAQMNPHFIFNSLNTVNGFIMRQDSKGAIEYVSQFSKLMRKTLEHSRVGSISLEEEIELLELYLKIEARRFSQPFTYSITTGNEVDMFGVKIPSMLLQPFVENAIKHGLFHKKEAGHINIAFLLENGSLKCVVEDNGVGRAKAAEINAQQGRSHVSRGLEIVEERLEILHKSSPEKGAIKTIDLFDLQRNPIGTRVEIKLPLAS